MGKLSPNQVVAIRASYLSLKELAAEYGVTKTTIRNTQMGFYHREPDMAVPVRADKPGPPKQPPKPKPEPTNLCACGCGGTTFATWAVGHNPSSNAARSDAEILERELANTVETDRDQDSPCLISKRPPNQSHGYPQIQRHYRTYTLHRWIYLVSNGIDDLPRACIIEHACDIGDRKHKACINPDHLFVSTNAANLRRAMSKLTLEEVKIIKYSGLTTRELADKYGTALQTIRQIRNGTRWGDA